MSLLHKPQPYSLLAPILFAVFTNAHADASHSSVWTRWETDLTSKTAHANPYTVELKVTYSGPGGERLESHGFWDGDAVFKLRFMFPRAGQWTWETSCVLPADCDLGHRSGKVQVMSYTGENPLYKNGYLKISTDKRYLTYANGAPFLWAGDTAWAAPIAASQAEWEAYIRQRKALGFNVIQVHSGRGFIKQTRDRQGNAPFTGSGPGLKWSPGYWQALEKKVQYANNEGILVFLTAVRQPGDGFPEKDADQVARFARNLTARLMGNFVLYSPVADDVWSGLADIAGNAIASATPLHLVGAHPRFTWSAANDFHAPSWADFVGLQSGNGWTFDPYLNEPKAPFDPRIAVQNAITWPKQLVDKDTKKPVINLEFVYDAEKIQEGDPSRAYYKQPYPARLPRSTAYLSLLSGAAGITYGVGGVWNWGVPTRNASGGWSFATALAQPSGQQMKYLFDLFSGLPWWTLLPSNDPIMNQPVDVLNQMALAKSRDGTLAIAYLPDNSAISLDMESFSGSVMAKWFNPVTNNWMQEFASVPNSGRHTFTKPKGWQDAILLLQSKAQKDIS